MSGGIALITIVVIQTNGEDIKTTARQCPETKKWEGWIYLWRNGRPHAAQLSETKATHDTEALAVAAMDKVVQDVRDDKYMYPAKQTVSS